MKKSPVPFARRSGARARISTEGRAMKTVLVFESRAKVYCWSTDRGARPIIKH